MTIFSGVYEIRNIVNGHRYIGSSVNFPKRLAEHKRCLLRGNHHSVYLQRAWSMYGEESFVCKVLLYCDPSNLLLYEQVCMDGLHPEYNIAQTAGSNLGCVWSEEARANMSAAHIGVTPWNKGTKGIMIAWNKGLKASLPMSEEARHRMSESRKGKPHGPLPEETKKKIGDANRGKPKPPRSEEHRRNISIAAKAGWVTRRATL